MKRYITTEDDRESLTEYINALTLGEWGFHCEVKLGTRTLRQNNSIYLYFTMLSSALNDAGYECVVKITDGVEIEIPWTQDLVKRLLWGPIMQKMYRIKSTAKLNRAQVSEVYDSLNRFTGARMGVFVPFPDRHGNMV